MVQRQGALAGIQAGPLRQLKNVRFVLGPGVCKKVGNQVLGASTRWWRGKNAEERLIDVNEFMLKYRSKRF